MPTQRHHLQYGAASNPHGRPRFVLRLPEFLFLGAVGLFLLTTQLKPRGGLQQPAAAPPAAAASKTASQVWACVFVDADFGGWLGGWVEWKAAAVVMD